MEEPMKIYNTLTRKKEEFQPIEEGKVRMYVCGPTVYNYIHIGNARPMIIFDTFRRYLEYKGYEVNYVSNFTDVDDKIIKEAIEEGITAEDVSARFIAECKKDMADLNLKPATTHPLATQEIDGMIEMIKTLIEKGYAYAAADGTVYYRTRKFEGYGKLSHKNIDDLEAGHRNIKVTGDLKEDPLDFVLWKPKKDGEPYWESPWCEGRPGWHIECSVMAKKYLGDTIDIHAGGEDLIFPHHENEIAQSEAANGVPFAHYWMHNGFLNINNQKMSKSLGNFFTVREIGEKYDLQVLRFFMLSAHYRTPLNFSAELMDAAKSGLERVLTAVDNLKHLSGAAKTEHMTDEEKAAFSASEDFVKKFEAAMEESPVWSDMLKQLSKRNACRVYRLPSAISTEDLRQVWEFYGFREPDAGLRASVEAAAQDSGYGVITKRMNLARIAAKNAGVTVTWDYYLGAIKKLQDMEDGNMPDDV